MILHVAVNGSDDGDGSLNTPFATPGAALLRSRSSGCRMIRIGGGVYGNTSLHLDYRDNGLTLEAEPGEVPVLLGAIRLTDWTKERNGWYSSPLPETARPGIRILLVDGLPAPRSRIPDEGVLRHDTQFTVPWLSASEGGWTRQPSRRELTTLLTNGDEPSGWCDPGNGEIQIFHQWDDSLVGIKGYDSLSRTLTLSRPCTYPPGAFYDLHVGVNEKARHYIVWNLREGMSRPGQWYHDRKANRVVYWPKDGQEMGDLTVYAPLHRKVISIRDRPGRPAQGIAVRGLTLGGANTRLIAANMVACLMDGAVSLRGTRGVVLDSLLIRNTTGSGIHSRPFRRGRQGERALLQPAEELTLSRCRVESCGASGILINALGAKIHDNTVSEIGLIYPSAAGISVTGSRIQVSSNAVFAVPYSAIHSCGSELTIEFNQLSDYMRALDDGAAIYLFAGKDSVLRGNLAVGGGRDKRLAYAYYLDERSDHCLIEGNCALRTTSPVLLHMASNCTLRGNVFFDTEPTVVKAPRCTAILLEGNLFTAPRLEIFTAGEGGITLRDNLFRVPAGALYQAEYANQGYVAGPFRPLDAAGNLIDVLHGEVRK